MRMDTQAEDSQRFHESTKPLKLTLSKAREILAMATLSPLSLSGLQTPSGSLSDVSDCGTQSSDYGYSALHGAVISNDVEYLEFLFNSGCELDQRDENGFTALHVGTLQKSIEGVQRLIVAGCNTEKLTKEGMSALHIAVDLPDNSQVLSLLASAIPNISIKNKVGRTALHLSAKSGNQEYLKILLDADCDRDIKDKFGLKAVDIARSNGHSGCVQILLHHVARKHVFEKPIKDRSRELSKNAKPSYERERKNPKDANLGSAGVTTNDKLDDMSQLVSNTVISDSSTRKTNLLKTNATSMDQLDRVIESQPVCQSECAPTAQDHEIQSSEQDPSFNSRNNGFNTIFAESQDGGKNEVCSSGLTASDNKRIGQRQEDVDFTNASAPRHRETNASQRHPTIYLEDQCDSTIKSTLFSLPSSFCQLPSTSQFTAASSKKVSSLITKPQNPSNEMLAASLYSIQHPPNGSLISNRRSIELSDLHRIILAAISISVKHRLYLWKCLPTKPKQSDECKKELMSYMATISSVQLIQESLFCNSNEFMVDFTFPEFKTEKINPDDILFKLLQGINRTLDSTGFSGYCDRVDSNTSNNLTENKLSSIQILREKPQDFVELFLAASQDNTVHGGDACTTRLQDLCMSSNSDVSYIHTLVDGIFTRTKLSANSVSDEQTSLANLVAILKAVEYVIQHYQTPSLFASNVLEKILNSSITVGRVSMTVRPEFMKSVIAKCLRLEESFWDEDKIADVFLFVSHILVNDKSFLLKYTDLLLRAAFSCGQINDMALCSRILVRLGLLKSEFKIDIFPHLKGPLLALAHVFAQDYFPAHLASLFVSFLAKPSPRFQTVREHHTQALKAAMLTEILDENILLGKGLKRICNVLAHGEYWETANQCCEALFDASFCHRARFTSIEQGSSILVYFGLIKSEYQVEVIEDIKNGLKLLQHAVNDGKIPEAIATMLVVFLDKNSNKLYPYKEEVAQLVTSLEK